METVSRRVEHGASGELANAARILRGGALP